MKLESFYVKLGGMGDDRLIPTKIMFGFIEPGTTKSLDVDIEVFLPEQLDATLQELRSQALAKAVPVLQAALEAATQSTPEQLHAAMLDHIRDSEKAWLAGLGAPPQSS
jgi:hypothetical protein